MMHDVSTFDSGVACHSTPNRLRDTKPAKKNRGFVYRQIVILDTFVASNVYVFIFVCPQKLLYAKIFLVSKLYFQAEFVLIMRHQSLHHRTAPDLERIYVAGLEHGEASQAQEWTGQSSFTVAPSTP